MARQLKQLERRFPADQWSRQTVTTVVEQAVEEARTDEVRRELQEALEEAGAPA